MSWLDFLVPEDVLVVRHSLDTEPQEWEPYYIGPDLFELRHRRSCVTVWTRNRAYGVNIKGPDGHLWGGVGFLSSAGLSPGHWVLSAAIGRWERDHGHPQWRKRTAAELICGGRS